MLKPWLLLAIALILDTMGTVLFKHGTNQLESEPQHGLRGHWQNILNAVKRKEIALGLFIYMIEYVVWVAYISTTPLNIAFSLSSLNIILVMLASHFILGEQVTKRRYFGASLILVGVLLVGGTA